MTETHGGGFFFFFSPKIYNFVLMISTKRQSEKKKTTKEENALRKQTLVLHELCADNILNVTITVIRNTFTPASKQLHVYMLPDGSSNQCKREL